MLDARPRKPTGLPKKLESPALASVPRCPNCGHEPAVVFPLIGRRDTPRQDALLVCLDCCLDARDRL